MECSIYKVLTCTLRTSWKKRKENRASCYSARLSWALVQTKTKKVGFHLGKNRLSHYDIRAEGTLPPSRHITVIAMLGYWICNACLKRINSKI